MTFFSEERLRLSTQKLSKKEEKVRWSHCSLTRTSKLEWEIQGLDFGGEGPSEGHDGEVSWDFYEGVKTCISVLSAPV